MEAIAKTRHLKGSPRKARLVIDLIRGRNVSQALNILKFTDKRAADPIAKTLRSAIANATYLAEQQNIAIDPDDLFIKTCFVDMGAHKNRRRMRPAPQGRAFREQRHYCHITILVSSEIEALEDTKSARKSLRTASEKGDSGAKLKAEPKAKVAKPKTAETKEPKKAKAEKRVSVKEETPKVEPPIVETPQITETAEVETLKAKAETVKMPEVSETESEITVEPKVEETEAASIATVETSEPEIVTTEILEPTTEETTVTAEKPTETVETVAEEPKTEISEPEAAKSENTDALDILEVESPKTEAKAKVEKQKAEASDAKNVQSQTPAELNETKKADNAQLDENDLLELQ